MVEQSRIIEIDLHLRPEVSTDGKIRVQDVPSVIKGVASDLEVFLAEDPEVANLQVRLPGLSLVSGANCFHLVLKIEAYNF